MIWANLLHLSFNMWVDRNVPDRDSVYYARPYLRFDESLWNDLLPAMADAGVNMVVLDLGDGVRYESHPEIAVENAWSVDKLRAELARMRAMGLEPIPKLNFSASHDAWLGTYSHCVSTPIYYDVCRDLIGEVIDIFDNPRLFHLGMDEETPTHQDGQEYVVVRQFDLWWHDLLFYVDQVEKMGARAWVWSDYFWHHPDKFLANMPKSVLQSNWYYEPDMEPQSGPEVDQVGAYRKLEEHGYDQVPTGSNWITPVNFGRTVEFCKKQIAPERLKGFLQTLWYPTLEQERQKHMDAIQQIKQARQAFEAAR